MESDNISYCIYCHRPIESHEAYSLRTVNGKTHYWHYLCYENQAVELIPIPEQAKKELLSYLLRVFKNDLDGWQLEVVRALGYGK